jgi:hypothetical protein
MNNGNIQDRTFRIIPVTTLPWWVYFYWFNILRETIQVRRELNGWINFHDNIHVDGLQLLHLLAPLNWLGPWHFWPIVSIIGPPQSFFLNKKRTIGFGLRFFLLLKTIDLINVSLQLIDYRYRSNRCFFRHRCSPMDIVYFTNPNGLRGRNVFLLDGKFEH